MRSPIAIAIWIGNLACLRGSDHQVEQFPHEDLEKDSLLDVTWRDKVSNKKVLERTQSDSMYTILTTRDLPWFGHVCRIPDHRLSQSPSCTVRRALKKRPVVGLSSGLRIPFVTI